MMLNFYTPYFPGFKGTNVEKMTKFENTTMTMNNISDENVTISEENDLYTGCWQIYVELLSSYLIKSLLVFF